MRCITANAPNETPNTYQKHYSESGGRMPFHAFGSFAVTEQSERR